MQFCKDLEFLTSLSRFFAGLNYFPEVISLSGNEREANAD